MQSIVAFAVLALLILWSSFWIIRLGVRYGMNDALRMNQTQLTQPPQDPF